ncbi:MAG: hypothetical protein SGPRY_011803 [Prymnesium sp.]
MAIDPPPCNSSSCGVFSSFAHVTSLGDEWQTTLFNQLCFDPSLSAPRRSRWVLPYTRAQPNASKHKAPALVRFPLTFLPSETGGWGSGGEVVGGVSFIADLRHAGGGPPGIAHFAKRMLRLHALQIRAGELGLPRVGRVVFPATSSSQLSTGWPRALLALIAPLASTLPSDHLTTHPRCFAHAITSSRENTYFTRPADAHELRAKAYLTSLLPLSRPPCAPLRGCYIQRAQGGRANTGTWEGGPRTVANWEGVVRQMKRIVAAVAPGGRVEIVRVNSSMSFAAQVREFASCDALCSVHGSQNANVMFMRPGSSFMEINPYKFFYSSYEALATVANVRYMSSRLNSIHKEGMSRKALAQAQRTSCLLAPLLCVETADISPLSCFAEEFERAFGSKTDDWCQENGKCRKLARNFPTLVNLSSFEEEFTKGVRHAAKQLRGCQ